MIEVAGALPPADRRSVFANAPMGIALTTPRGLLVDVNPALAEMTGRSAEQLEHWMPRIHSGEARATPPPPARDVTAPDAA